MAEHEGAPTEPDAIVIGLYPDVCEKDGCRVPYDVYALATDDATPSPDVRYRGQRALHAASRLSVTYGDLEAVAGVKSGVVGGHCRPVDDMSATVRVNGRRAVRDDTEFEMNCAGPEGLHNTIGRLILLGQLPAYLRPKGPHLVGEEWEKQRQEILAKLKEHYDRPDFYDVLADYDWIDADRWNAMTGVQARFASGEPFYSDLATRTYSESVRQTLHASVINLFEDPQGLATVTGPGGPGLYDWYIRMHGTAFRANGAWNLDFLDNGAEVLSNTDPAMLGNADQLAQGVQETDPYALAAAEAVRAARAALGLKVTRRPGESPR